MDGKLSTIEQIKRFVRAAYGHKQDRIKGIPGEMLTIGDDGLLSSLSRNALNGAIVPRKNILVNSRFDHLFNQRGQTSYTASGTVANAMDSWMVGNGTITLKSNKISINQVKNNDTTVRRNVLLQSIDHPDVFAGQWLTLSFLIPEIGASTDMGLSAWITGNKINVTTPDSDRISTPGLISLTFKMPENVLSTDDFQIYTLVSPGGTFRPKAAKLEVGTTQTLAYKNQNGEWVEYEPCASSEYITLTQLECLRKQIVFRSGNVSSTNGIGYFHSYTSSNDITMFVPTPVPMKSTPTFDFDGRIRLISGDFGGPITIYIEKSDLLSSPYPRGSNNGVIIGFRVNKTIPRGANGVVDIDNYESMAVLSCY